MPQFQITFIKTRIPLLSISGFNYYLRRSEYKRKNNRNKLIHKLAKLRRQRQVTEKGRLIAALIGDKRTVKQLPISDGELSPTNQQSLLLIAVLDWLSPTISHFID